MTQSPGPNLWRSLRELLRTIPPPRRRQFYAVLTLMIVGAFAELAAIGSVVPFLSLLADPSRVEQVPLLMSFFEAIGATTARQRLVAAAAVFAALAILAGAVRLQLAWSSQSFVYRLGHDWAVDIQRRLLLQPYTFHINHNTSGLVASLEKVQSLVFNVLLQLMQSGIAAFISIFIIAGLIYVDPITAISAATAFAAIYIGVSAVTRKRLKENSRIIGPAYDERVQLVQESLGGIRDIIIDGSQAVYLEAFRKIDERFAIAKSNTAFIGAAPRFVIEAFGMVLIATMAVVISGRGEGFATALPVLGALALGAQRLLPLLQQMYFGWTIASGHGSIAEQVLELLQLPAREDDVARNAAAAPLPLRESIRVQQVSFWYGSRRTPALRDVSLEIPRGCSVALIGKTGSGKSTLADLLMGLLEPKEGQICVDGQPLTGETRRRWQRSIAHVPQAIFLADASVARNIAFGVAEEHIDFARVVQAATTAQLHEFVSALPQGYETFVGERGVRLSGGQRQRLGIARAIYKQAPVLVLDEATSALDDDTEAAVMKALETLGEQGRTVIMIAHRLSTLARADIVARLKDGRLVELGTHAEVLGARPAVRGS